MMNNIFDNVWVQIWVVLRPKTMHLFIVKNDMRCVENNSAVRLLMKIVIAI